MRSLFRDDKAATVIFGTLMIILITIVVSSTLMLILSHTMKVNAERQQTIDDQRNENLKIISIKPEDLNSNSTPLGFWTGFDFIIFNGDVKNANINAIYVNDKPMLKRFLYDDTGGMELYDQTKLIPVPSRQAVKVHVGAITWTEELLNSSSVIKESPNIKYPNTDCSGWWNITDSSGTEVNNSTYTVLNNTMPPIYLPSTASYPCNISYTMFPKNELYNINYKDSTFLKTNPVKVNLLTSRVNLFSKVFSPPIPIADMQYRSETMPDLSMSYYLILEGSGSTAPNGFITKYEWDVGNYSASYGWDYKTLYGNKIQFPYKAGNNYEINLNVTDNFGMTSDLTDRSGNITI